MRSLSAMTRHPRDESEHGMTRAAERGPAQRGRWEYGRGPILCPGDEPSLEMQALCSERKPPETFRTLRSRPRATARRGDPARARRSRLSASRRFPDAPRAQDGKQTQPRLPHTCGPPKATALTRARGAANLGGHVRRHASSSDDTSLFPTLELRNVTRTGSFAFELSGPRRNARNGVDCRQMLVQQSVAMCL